MAQGDSPALCCLCTNTGDSEGPVRGGAKRLQLPLLFPRQILCFSPDEDVVGVLGTGCDSPAGCARLPQPRPWDTGVWRAGDGNKLGPGHPKAPAPLLSRFWWQRPGSTQGSPGV